MQYENERLAFLVIELSQMIELKENQNYFFGSFKIRIVLLKFKPSIINSLFTHKSNRWYR